MGIPRSLQILRASLSDTSLCLGTADVFWTIGDVHVLSRALIRVATFLGAFAAFYTTIYAASDPVYSASFSDDVGGSLQQAVDVRRVYLAAKDA